MNVNEVVHWYIVKVLNDKREVVECLKWSGLKWELRIKYDWYFKYRAALLQIKYPRFLCLFLLESPQNGHLKL